MQEKYRHPFVTISRHPQHLLKNKELPPRDIANRRNTVEVGLRDGGRVPGGRAIVAVVQAVAAVGLGWWSRRQRRKRRDSVLRLCGRAGPGGIGRKFPGVVDAKHGALFGPPLCVDRRGSRRRYGRWFRRAGRCPWGYRTYRRALQSCR